MYGKQQKWSNLLERDSQVKSCSNSHAHVFQPENSSLKNEIGQRKKASLMVFLIGENGHVVISAVYRIRYEYIADVINERIISDNKKVFYFIFVTFK